VVRVIDLNGQSAGPLTLKWDGKTSDGAQAVDGVYNISVSALRDEEKIEAQTLSLATVQGVSQGNQGVRLNLGALGTVSLADVKEIF
jgi:flagellar basal-body rod modification protein FlgD